MPNRSLEHSLGAHYGLAPRAIGIGCPNENGDVESSNGHLKRRLKQRLLVRGSSDFASEADYDRFCQKALDQANGTRSEALAQELAAMKALPPTRLSEYEEVYCPVSKYSTIRVKKVGYSVPARWIGHEVKVEVHESELKIYAGRELLLTLPRQGGDRGVVLDYRHVIDHLLRKPGAFEEYRYRQELFLSPTYRQAYDRLIAEQGPRRGTLEYLRLLKLTSETGPGEVELMLVEYVCPPYPTWSVEQIRKTLWPAPSCQIQLAELQPECQSYDALLTTEAEVAMSADALALAFRSFRLPTMAAIWEESVTRAEGENWGYRRLLQHLCESEAQDRRERRVGRLLKQSGLPDGKTLGNLEEAALPPKIRRLLPTLLEGGFVERAENVLAFGLPGRGKTHFLAAVARELILRHRYPVLFTPTFKLVQQLLTAKKELRLEEELKQLDRYPVVVLDDLGYVQQDRAEMEVLFTFLAERYERRSVMISSNLVFSKWDQIFKDPMTTMAAIDRLVHHAVILEFNGESVRAQKARGKAPPQETKQP